MAAGALKCGGGKWKDEKDNNNQITIVESV
jgi:hypothetical protein